MPSVYDLKPRFQALLRPAIARLASLGVTANGVTLAALLGSVVVGFCFAGAEEHPALFLIMPLWLLVRMALNAVDGMMARELGMKSNLGAVLNELGDIMSDVALYLPFGWIHLESRPAVIVFAALAVMTEYCGVLAQALGGSRRYDGPMGKSDRAFWIGALSLVAFVQPLTMRYWPMFFALIAVAALLTSVHRVGRALVELAEHK